MGVVEPTTCVCGVLKITFFSDHRARAGTKVLVERFVDECVAAIRAVAQAPSMAQLLAERLKAADSTSGCDPGRQSSWEEGDPTDLTSQGKPTTARLPPLPPRGSLPSSATEKLEFLESARLAMGRTALCLSGGGSLAMYHMGVVKALIESDSLPRIISGTSGGAIVAAMLCMRTDSEMLSDVILPDTVDLYGVTWFDPLPKQIATFATSLVSADRPYTMRSERFAHTCRQYYGTVTFADAFRRTGRVVSIVITVRYGTGPTSAAHPFLVNYITCPNVYVWSAVAASCALPGLMPPASLIARPSLSRAMGAASSPGGESAFPPLRPDPVPPGSRDWGTQGAALALFPAPAADSRRDASRLQLGRARASSASPTSPMSSDRDPDGPRSSSSDDTCLEPSRQEVPFHPHGVHSLDGSMRADIPCDALARMFHVNRFITSQVNPHIAPFLREDHFSAGLPPSSSAGSAPDADGSALASAAARVARSGGGGLSALLSQVRLWMTLDVQYRTHRLARMRLLPRFFGADLSGIFTQRYRGHVTISPRMTLLDQFKALSHPSKSDMVKYIHEGELATWPKLSHVRTLVAAEKALSRAVRVVRAQVAAEAAAARALSPAPGLSGEAAPLWLAAPRQGGAALPLLMGPRGRGESLTLSAGMRGDSSVGGETAAEAENEAEVEMDVAMAGEVAAGKDSAIAHPQVFGGALSTQPAARAGRAGHTVLGWDEGEASVGYSGRSGGANPRRRSGARAEQRVHCPVARGALPGGAGSPSWARRGGWQGAGLARRPASDSGHADDRGMPLEMPQAGRRGSWIAEGAAHGDGLAAAAATPHARLAGFSPGHGQAPGRTLFSPAEHRLPPSRASTERRSGVAMSNIRQTPGSTPARSGHLRAEPPEPIQWGRPAGPESSAGLPRPMSDEAKVPACGNPGGASPLKAGEAVLVDSMVAVPADWPAGAEGVAVAPLTPPTSPLLTAGQATGLEGCIGRFGTPQAGYGESGRAAAAATQGTYGTGAGSSIDGKPVVKMPSSRVAQPTSTRSEAGVSERSWRRSVAPHVALALQLSPGGRAELSRSRAATAGITGQL